MCVFCTGLLSLLFVGCLITSLFSAGLLLFVGGIKCVYFLHDCFCCCCCWLVA